MFEQLHKKEMVPGSFIGSWQSYFLLFLDRIIGLADEGKNRKP